MAVTEGIRVEVTTQYLSDQSARGRFAFSYSIRIANEGLLAAKLVSRHWIITDAEGKIEEVQGDGVVGHQPYLKPGQSFEYTSGCVLETPQGSMHGTYQMVRDDGSRFDAVIDPFVLAVPNSLN